MPKTRVLVPREHTQQLIFEFIKVIESVNSRLLFYCYVSMPFSLNGYPHTRISA